MIEAVSACDRKAKSKHAVEHTAGLIAADCRVLFSVFFFFSELFLNLQHRKRVLCDAHIQPDLRPGKPVAL